MSLFITCLFWLRFTIPYVFVAEGRCSDLNVNFIPCPLKLK